MSVVLVLVVLRKAGYLGGKDEDEGKDNLCIQSFSYASLYVIF